MIRNAAPALWAKLLQPAEADGDGEGDAAAGFPRPTLESVLGDAGTAEGARGTADGDAAGSALLALPHEVLLRVLFFAACDPAASERDARGRRSLVPSPLPRFYPVRLLRLRRVCKDFDALALDASLWRILDLSRERRLETRDALVVLLRRAGRAPRVVSLGRGVAASGTTSTQGIYKLLDDEIVANVAVACGHHLTHLDLSHCDGISGALSPPGVHRPQMPALTALVLASCRSILPTFPAILASAHPVELQILDISGCRAVDSLAPLAAACPKLARLYAGNTSVGDDAWDAYLAGRRASGIPCRLRVLHIQSTPISDDALRLLAAGCPDLAELDAGGTDVTDAGVAALGGCAELEYLNLRNCRGVESEAGVKALGDREGSKLRKVLLPLGKWTHFAWSE